MPISRWLRFQLAGGNQPHGEAAGMPAGGRQAVKHTGFGGLGVGVKRLRVELAGKGDDFVLLRVWLAVSNRGPVSGLRSRA
jgi:hypothetical protein